MSASTSELLARLAHTIRNEIAPEVGEEYARTQAFMASVVLQRLSKHVELEPLHAAAAESDIARLRPELGALLADAPESVVAVAGQLAAVDDLGPLIRELYAWGVDHPDAAEALAAVRRVLRADIDRRMEVAT